MRNAVCSPILLTLNVKTTANVPALAMVGQL